MSHSTRILVVDDDQSIREAVAAVLSDDGYEVTTATNGREALQQVQQDEQPALILLDLRMPVMTGWEFAHAYHEASPPHAPIVVMTAARDAADFARDVAVAGVLAKPFGLDELTSVVERCLAPD